MSPVLREQSHSKMLTACKEVFGGQEEGEESQLLLVAAAPESYYAPGAGRNCGPAARYIKMKGNEQ